MRLIIVAVLLLFIAPADDVQIRYAEEVPRVILFDDLIRSNTIGRQTK